MEHPFSQFKYCPKCGSVHFEINNEKSKRCADCEFVYYFNPSAATTSPESEKFLGESIE